MSVKPLPIPPSNLPTPSFPVLWSMLGRLVGQMLSEAAHAEIALTLKDGKIQLVRVNRTYLPSNVPQV